MKDRKKGNRDHGGRRQHHKGRSDRREPENRTSERSGSKSKYGRDVLAFPPFSLRLDSKQGDELGIRLLAQEKGEGCLAVSMLGKRRTDKFSTHQIAGWFTGDTDAINSATKGRCRVALKTADMNFEFTGFCQKKPNSGGEPEVPGDRDMSFDLPMQVVRSLLNINSVLLRARAECEEDVRVVMNHFDSLKSKDEPEDKSGKEPEERAEKDEPEDKSENEGEESPKDESGRAEVQGAEEASKDEDEDKSENEGEESPKDEDESEAPSILIETPPTT